MSFRENAAPKSIVFILGMGRSGTSALTRVLALCGCCLPETLVSASENNPLGHWEPLDALRLNDTFLAKFGATWFDPTLRLQGELTVSKQQCSEYIEQVKTFLRSLPAAPLHVIKEPRIAAVSSYWFEAAQQLGVSTGVIIPVRHPREVASSLATRDQASMELSSALWLKYSLLAERQSRAMPRVVVEYTNVLRDWRGEVSRIATALSIDLSRREEAAIDSFLRQDLRRQRTDGQIIEVFGQHWISNAYAILAAAARDQVLDTQALDKIYDSYRACEHAFRVALDEFRARFGPPEPVRGRYIRRLVRAMVGRDTSFLRRAFRKSRLQPADN